MPLYQYWCEACLRPFELYMKLEFCDSEVWCPFCRVPLTKIIMPVYFTRG